MRKITFRTFCIVILQAFLVCESAFSTSYYVDSQWGRDGNDGSSSTPWKTIDRVNMASLIAGDAVYFKRGGIYRGTLLPKSGTASSYITYGAYGGGTTDKPKLFASYQRNSTSDWQDEGGNIWSTGYKPSLLEPEKLLNPSFATNTADWNFYSNTAVTPTISATFTRSTVTNEYYDGIGGGGKVTCVNNGNSATDIQFSTHGFDIIAATWYKFTFKARASANFSAPIKLIKNGDPYTNYVLSSTASNIQFTSGSWSSYEIYIQTNYTTDIANSADKARITIQLGNALPDGGSLFVDGFSIKECNTPPEYLSEDIGNVILGNLSGIEKLLNPSFLTNTTNWNLYYNGTVNPAISASLTRSTATNEYFDALGGGKITCVNNGNMAGDIQFYTHGFDILATKWYKFTFKARATGNFSAPIQVIKNGPPYTNYISSSSTSSIQFLSGDWNSYEVYFQSNYTTDVENSADKARIAIQLGNLIPDGGSLYIDALSLQECKTPPLYYYGDGIKNFILGDEGSCGTKVWNQTDLNVEGEFWFDTILNRLFFYTTQGNPATNYSSIELATKKMNISAIAKSYITIENLDLRYGGGGGVYFYEYPQKITIRGLDISFIGGAKLSGTTRGGNGIQFWNGAKDIIVERCRISQVYDSGISPQGDLNGHICQSIYFRNNIIDKCEQSFEMWQRGTSSLSNVYFEQNTCANSGYGWSHAQRPDPRGVHLLFWGFDSTVTISNIQIRNNVYLKARDYGIYSHWADDINKVAIDYSCWYPGTSIPLLRVNYPALQSYDWASYRSAFSDDSHSILVNPQLNSDGSLASGSPCRDAGLTLSTTNNDFYNIARPQGTGYDIGAFEYVIPPAGAPAMATSIDTIVADNGLSVSLYPNPATDHIFVKFENFPNTPMQLLLIRLDGKVIQKEIVYKVDAGIFRLNFRQKPNAGLYLIKVAGEEFSKTIPVAIQ